ncbi:TIGR02391 family protein [Burkholderia stabilis]|uniref:TIGR02391 family protein n=1 Tax=Burkholderia stabilis TaxID=95485 RepID=UPI001F4A9CCD|nr:TIGR02391 family protein [Burkholderia stabilis]
MSMQQAFPKYDDFVRLPTEDVAELLFFWLRGLGGQFYRGEILGQADRMYGHHQIRFVRRAMCEAWQLLEHRELIVETSDPSSAGWFEITSKGYALEERALLRKFLESDVLPASFLEERIARDALPLFQRADFDTAVFKAFKLLEVAIREAAGLSESVIGTALAQEAFKPDGGPLTDKSSEKGERVALMNLMSGAIGTYKNPHSHRHVSLVADEARDMLILASQLMRIVNSRRGPQN